MKALILFPSGRTLVEVSRVPVIGQLLTSREPGSVVVQEMCQVVAVQWDQRLGFYEVDVIVAESPNTRVRDERGQFPGQGTITSYRDDNSGSDTTPIRGSDSRSRRKTRGRPARCRTLQRPRRRRGDS